MCKRVDRIDMAGDPVVQAAHVKAKGMGGAVKAEYGNLIPLCGTNSPNDKFKIDKKYISCHQFYDEWPQDKKERLRFLAVHLSKQYLKDKGINPEKDNPEYSYIFDQNL